MVHSRPPQLATPYQLLIKKITRLQTHLPHLGPRNGKFAGAIFGASLLLESVTLQVITSTQFNQPQPYLAQAPVGQVATAPGPSSQPTVAPTITAVQSLISTQVSAATITPTPVPTPPPFRSPLASYTLTQRFSSYHQAIDMAATYGTPVYAANQGTVLATGYILAGGGLMVKIGHRDGFVTYYAHLSSIQARVGQSVDHSTQIGRIGSTGWSTGPHLHFIVEQNQRSLNPFSILE